MMTHQRKNELHFVQNLTFITPLSQFFITNLLVLLYKLSSTYQLVLWNRTSLPKKNHQKTNKKNPLNIFLLGFSSKSTLSSVSSSEVNGSITPVSLRFGLSAVGLLSDSFFTQQRSFPPQQKYSQTRLTFFAFSFTSC